MTTNNLFVFFDSTLYFIQNSFYNFSGFSNNLVCVVNYYKSFFFITVSGASESRLPHHISTGSIKAMCH